jgi:hypothetical protein
VKSDSQERDVCLFASGVRIPKSTIAIVATTSDLLYTIVFVVYAQTLTARQAAVRGARSTDRAPAIRSGWPSGSPSS